ncbi:uncharacterized protein P174DRAFT_435279 [Aspergillus novofumigatus IBT 16806]|uniref:Uncharacterized protein n=1 Tax=Aspergillus novofumigatus (strain IBT 16806) TaxID=1392255 RepID=A0A2I1BUT0_ASPN1|nr:uncharacterized protein P174DRAFT_435279 [Aspergillus novofumigatus IBT 16806]PKX89157.1 hypothetical protein P174DRAFT_435279 [Aspergillus novofumigatus IBT 16806]
MCLNGRRECHYPPVGAVEPEEESEQLKVSGCKQAPVVPPYVHSIDNEAYLSPLSSETTDINSPVLQNIIGINSSLGGLQERDIIINHGAAMGTAPSPVETPTVTLRAYRCDQDLINASYIFIHPYFPFLPPSIVPQYEDRPVSITVPDAEPKGRILGNRH